MPADEYLDWQLLEQVDPWGQFREDYRAAVICWVLASVNCTSETRRPKLKDYLGYFNFINIEKDDIDSEILDKVEYKHQH